VQAVGHALDPHERLVADPFDERLGAVAEPQVIVARDARMAR